MKSGLTMLKLRVSLRILAIVLAALLFTRLFFVGGGQNAYFSPAPS
jgi:hypothetical protein